MKKKELQSKLDHVANQLSLLGTKLDEIHLFVKARDKKEVRAIRLDCCGHASALHRISILQ